MMCQLCDNPIKNLEDGVYYEKCDKHLFHLNCVLDKSYGSVQWSTKSQQSHRMKKESYTSNFECDYCGKKRDKIADEILGMLNVKRSNCLIF